MQDGHLFVGEVLDGRRVRVLLFLLLLLVDVVRLGASAEVVDVVASAPISLVNPVEQRFEVLFFFGLFFVVFG